MDNILVNDAVNDIIKEIDDKHLLYMTSGKIKELKNNILQKMYISREELLHYHKVLKDYRYVDELDELKMGSFIRWFNLTKPDNLKLTNGGIVIDIKPSDDDIIVVCKNYMNRIFCLHLNKSIIFQKLSSQEQILVKIIDYIHK